MIKVYDDKQVVITFGTGDIGVYGGDTNQSKIGYVNLMNQSPHEIGSKPEIDGPLEHAKVDVVMEFHKVESIDVMIRSLEAAKKCMTEKNVLDQVDEFAGSEECLVLRADDCKECDYPTICSHYTGGANNG